MTTDPNPPRGLPTPFIVNICEDCWEGVSWGRVLEREALFAKQVFYAVDGQVWLHRIPWIGAPSGAIPCEGSFDRGILVGSLIELPASARASAPPFYLSQVIDALKAILRDPEGRP